MPCHIPKIVFRRLYVQGLYIVVGRGSDGLRQLVAHCNCGRIRRVTGASQATQETGQYRSTFVLGRRRFKDVAVSKEPDLCRPGKREKVG